MRTLLCALAGVVALCACDGEAAMSPKSGGRPYEVLIVSAGAGGGGRLLADALSEDAPGLPQAEPLFDVSLTDSLRFNQTARLARNIVIVTVSPDRFTRTRIRYEKNVWARPQTVVYVNTPDTAALGRRLNQVGRHVADLLTRSEMNVEIARLADGGNAEAREMYDFDEAVMGPIRTDGPVTYREYLDALDKTPLPINFASMIGTGAVKITVKGFSDKPYTQAELDQARAIIEDAMAAGAPGVSLGIMYLPECYSSTDEFAYILEPVGRWGGVITTHIRGEGDSMVESVREVIEIARKAGCALEISHFKSCGGTIGAKISTRPSP